MSLYSSLTQVLAPYAAKLNGLLTGWNGTTYSTPGEAVRQQIADLHVLIGDEPGTAIQSSAVAYGEESVEDALDGLNERLTELEQGGTGGLTADVKAALLACFENVAWVTADGQSYYDALEAALYPPANLTSISAVYTQSGTVYDSDSLDDLKSDLVVTAHYSDNTSEVISNYTLSGTLTEGTSTVTAAYGGKTATFTVTVTHSIDAMYQLTNRTFDGTFAINSNVTPLDEDRDFTIAIDLTSDGTETQVSNARIYNFEGTNSGSSLIWAYGANKYIRLSFAGTSANITTLTSATSFDKFKFVATHTAGSGALNYYFAYETSGGETATGNDTITSARSVVSDKTMFVGGYSATQQFLNGVTIHNFTVFNEVLSAADINAFLAL